MIQNFAAALFCANRKVRIFSSFAPYVLWPLFCFAEVGFRRLRDKIRL